MKRIVFLLLIFIIAMTAWGSFVIAYASSPHAHALTLAPTPTAPHKMKTITDVPATVAPQMRSNVISEGSSSLPEIALTFDDGPTPAYTQQVLAILKQYNVHATFFCIGEQAQEFPDLLNQENAGGNVVANHSWNHPDLTTLSDDDIHAQLMSTSNTLKQATGIQPTLFRPPYGAINMQVKSQADALHLTPVLWSIDTEDWQLPGSDAIVNTVLDQASNGSIILMHDGGGDRSQTIEALPHIITGLQQHGYRLVTVPELINDANKQD